MSRLFILPLFRSIEYPRITVFCKSYEAFGVNVDDIVAITAATGRDSIHVVGVWASTRLLACRVPHDSTDAANLIGSSLEQLASISLAGLVESIAVLRGRSSIQKDALLLTFRSTPKWTSHSVDKASIISQGVASGVAVLLPGLLFVYSHMPQLHPPPPRMLFPAV